MEDSTILQPIQPAKITFWQGLTTAGISVIITILTVGFFFGGSIQRLNQLEAEGKDTKRQLEQTAQDVNNKLETIKQRMVDKDDFRELRNDVKELSKKK